MEFYGDGWQTIWESAEVAKGAIDERRLALDGEQYSVEEFVLYYGVPRWREPWAAAARAGENYRFLHTDAAPAGATQPCGHAASSEGVVTEAPQAAAAVVAAPLLGTRIAANASAPSATGDATAAMQMVTPAMPAMPPGLELTAAAAALLQRKEPTAQLQTSAVASCEESIAAGAASQRAGGASSAGDGAISGEESIAAGAASQRAGGASPAGDAGHDGVAMQMVGVAMHALVEAAVLPPIMLPPFVQDAQDGSLQPGASAAEGDASLAGAQIDANPTAAAAAPVEPKQPTAQQAAALAPLKPQEPNTELQSSAGAFQPSANASAREAALAAPALQHALLHPLPAVQPQPDVAVIAPAQPHLPQRPPADVLGHPPPPPADWRESSFMLEVLPRNYDNCIAALGRAVTWSNARALLNAAYDRLYDHLPLAAQY